MLSLGIDIGGTKAHAVVLDDDNAVVAEDAIFTRRGLEGVRQVTLEVAQRVADKVGVGLRDFGAVGIGIPGVVDRDKGEIASAVNLRIERMPLRELLADQFSAPISVDNDVKATVVAAGMLLDSTSVTYINFGTGIAAATLDGTLVRGKDNAAGEIGHLVLNPNGDPCRCGQRGCLETVVGGAYLAPRMDMLGLDWTKLDAADTPTGWAAYDQAVRCISQIVGIVAVAYAPERIVLGGGVIGAAPWVIPAVKSFLIDRGHMVTFPPYAEIAERVTTLDHDNQAPAIGAALIGRV
ncbi:MAG: ROK family protein [Propionibacteriaceae bacterium]|jgi:predicted NBD/HSP70 family sugar kinase|nr:ROK family protein [Propionibacteriaceae bacterium]